VIAREELVTCGLPLVPVIFARLGWEVSISLLVDEGEQVTEGVPLVVLEGSTRHLLSAERTILNFLQRMSGVATYTRRVVDVAHGITVLDTRKTMPGWRLLEKYSVVVGGGKNHRMHLGEMILVKNNHIDAHRGDIAGLFEMLRHAKPWYTPVQCEVRTIEELLRVLPCQPELLLFDNMEDDRLAEALRFLEGIENPPLVEVSGNVPPARLATLAALGVRCVSMGGLTTRATNVDISLRLTPLPEGG
jgi:nicotinate-nucleotide pyrophosphorylase (carboxylating)